ISSWFGAQKPHKKPDICLQLPILHLAEKRLVQPGASIYAAKTSAASGTRHWWSGKKPLAVKASRSDPVPPKSLRSRSSGDWLLLVGCVQRICMKIPIVIAHEISPNFYIAYLT
ncbi:hypothetical protein SOV99_12135, partial [Pectobacterium aroidearum]